MTNLIVFILGILNSRLFYAAAVARAQFDNQSRKSLLRRCELQNIFLFWQNGVIMNVHKLQQRNWLDFGRVILILSPRTFVKGGISVLWPTAKVYEFDNAPTLAVSQMRIDMCRTFVQEQLMIS